LHVPPSTKQFHSTETEMTQPVACTVSYDVPASESRSPIVNWSAGSALPSPTVLPVLVEAAAAVPV